MSLRDLIRREVSSVVPAEINYEVVEETSNDVAETISFCLSKFELSTCQDYINLVHTFVKNLGKVRVSKFLDIEKTQAESTDNNFLGSIAEIITKYYEILLLGFVGHDKRVAVEIKQAFKLNNRHYLRGGMAFIPILEAILLDSVGIVKILNPFHS
jgi:phosphotransacetylase